MAPLAEMTANGQDEALLDTGPSLQDAFKQFRMRKRQQQRQVPTKELREKAAARRAADPAGDKARLRSKFIAKCLENIGIPYAERYHKPGDALYGRAAPRGTRRVTTSHGRPRRQGVPGLLRVVPEGAAAIAAGLRI
jgi:hypothetical protein